ncbi:MFS transporter [Kitasatospora aureofaciens]|uniref:MFS transporter n=1 Tax=Kitasatospora aureofaciens TaxID=1894 RepID=A0A1E7MVK1_KITAU|nr:MFS transporter [Kitasatospora aureofaciens]OEV32461.1 metabolite transporter [Kitasatospora aureofaciens]QEU97998.1 MFS transporter [Streptomyces viridifaciens]UKZ10668.1 MFS transporter [Streptomyces viridifaciens]GGU68813.1 MFS transporter [Kitasatospora aureofaciens]
MSQTIDNAPYTAFHRRLALACSGGPLLDGYILSIVGVALIGMRPDLGLSTAQVSLIGAAALVGMFVGGALFGVLTDKIGREVMYTADLLVMVACSVLSFWVDSVWAIAVLRFVLGMAVAADYPIATSLLAEWLPAKHRGRLLGQQIVAWYAGSVLAYVVGYLFLELAGPGSWRWMLASSTVLCVVFLVIRRGSPESPRWLAANGRVGDAVRVVEKHLGVRVDGRELMPDPAERARRSSGLRLLMTPPYRRRTLFCGLFFLCQVGPLFAMLTFGPQILSSFGMPGGTVMETLGTGLISLVFLLGCYPALRLVDTKGRRPVIVWSFALMTVPLALLGVWPTAPAAVALTALCAYAFLCGGPNVLDWTYPNELFPTEIRATAVGVATSVSRIGAAVGTYLLPLSLTGLGTGPTMLIAAGTTALGLLVCVLWAEETRGTALGAAPVAGRTGTAKTSAVPAQRVPQTARG